MATTIATYSGVTFYATEDANLDSMGYKVWIPLTVTTASDAGMVLGFSGSYTVPEKQCPHFFSKEQARKYIDYCKDLNISADGAAAWSGTVEAEN